MHVKSKFLTTVALALVAVFVIAVAVDAQPKGKKRGEYFNPDTMTTLTITIDEINGLADDADKNNKTGKGMHYVVSSGATKYYAIFGPAFWLDEQGVELEVGTGLSVTGSVVDSWHEDFTDYQVIIVTELTLDGLTVKLRDAETGIPEWPKKKSYYKVKRWKPENIDTVSGIVTRVKTRTHGKNNDTGLEAIFTDEDGKRIIAFVGPTFYLEEIGLTIAVDDNITVTGSFVKGGKVLVQEIIVNGVTYTLRDEDGKPLWVVTE